VDLETDASASVLSTGGSGWVKTLGENVQILEVYILRGRWNTIYRLQTYSFASCVSIAVVCQRSARRGVNGCGMIRVYRPKVALRWLQHQKGVQKRRPLESRQLRANSQLCLFGTGLASLSLRGEALRWRLRLQENPGSLKQMSPNLRGNWL